MLALLSTPSRVRWKETLRQMHHVGKRTRVSRSRTQRQGELTDIIVIIIIILMKKAEERHLFLHPPPHCEREEGRKLSSLLMMIKQRIIPLHPTSPNQMTAALLWPPSNCCVRSNNSTRSPNTSGTNTRRCINASFNSATLSPLPQRIQTQVPKQPQPPQQPPQPNPPTSASLFIPFHLHHPPGSLPQQPLLRCAFTR